jgi:hypothetical protein
MTNYQIQLYTIPQLINVSSRPVSYSKSTDFDAIFTTVGI